MKILRLTPGHQPPKNPSEQYLRDTVWLKAFAESHAPGKKAIEAANRAEREFIQSKRLPE